MNNQHISEDTLIGDILAKYPESAQIMEDFGLNCTSCSVNAFEPVKIGAMSHGMSEAVADEMLEKLNELANARLNAKNGIYVSARASEKIAEFAEAESKQGWGLKITAHDNDGLEPVYAMDFQEKPKKNEKSFEFHGVQIILDKESEKNLQGADLDYLDTQFGSGFKVTNPFFIGAKKGGCCKGGEKGSGSCGCGGGSCGC